MPMTSYLMHAEPQKSYYIATSPPVKSGLLYYHARMCAIMKQYMWMWCASHPALPLFFNERVHEKSILLFVCTLKIMGMVIGMRMSLPQVPLLN